MCLPGNRVKILVNWKLRLSPDHFEFLMPLKHWVEKLVSLLARLSGPDYQGKFGSGSKEDYI